MPPVVAKMSNPFPGILRKFWGFFLDKKFLVEIFLPIFFNGLFGVLIFKSQKYNNIGWIDNKIIFPMRGSSFLLYLKGDRRYSATKSRKKPQNFLKIPGNGFNIFATTGGIFYRKISRRTLKDFWEFQLSNEVGPESVRLLWGPLWAPKVRAILLGQAVDTKTFFKTNKIMPYTSQYKWRQLAHFIPLGPNDQQQYTENNPLKKYISILLFTGGNDTHFTSVKKLICDF